MFLVFYFSNVINNRLSIIINNILYETVKALRHKVQKRNSYKDLVDNNDHSDR